MYHSFSLLILFCIFYNTTYTMEVQTRTEVDKYDKYLISDPLFTSVSQQAATRLPNELVDKIIISTTLRPNWWITKPKNPLSSVYALTLVDKAFATYINKNKIRLAKDILKANSRMHLHSDEMMLREYFSEHIMKDIFCFHQSFLTDDTSDKIKSKFNHPLYIPHLNYYDGTLLDAACTYNKNTLLECLIEKYNPVINGSHLHQCISFSYKQNSVDTLIQSLQVLLSKKPSIISAPVGAFKLPILSICLLEYPGCSQIFAHPLPNLLNYLPQIIHYLLECGANKNFRIPSNISTEYHKIAHYNAVDIVQNRYMNSDTFECRQMGNRLIPILQNTKQIYFKESAHPTT